MEEFLNSSRAYRPNTFDKIVGQDNIVKILRDEVLNKNISNAYLFCGARGTGKTTTARVFAKAINCRNNKNNRGNPCLNCENCNNSNSLGIFELDAASNNSVDDIRRIIEQIRFSNSFSDYNVFIIDEVHMLTQAAFNSFLKTLEEPPRNVVFILATTEFNKVPATIVSRCQTFNFKLISDSVIVTELKKILNDKKIKYDEKALDIIAEKAEGGLRDALSILDGIIGYDRNYISFENIKKVLNILGEEQYFEILEYILKGEKGKLVVYFNNILKNGFNEYSFLHGLLKFFINLLFAKHENTVDLINESICKKEEYINSAKNIEICKLENAVFLINEWSLNYKICTNKKMFIEILLIKISVIMM